MLGGLCLVATGLYLIFVKQLHISMGISGVQIICAVVGLGLLLLIPSKIYLTLILMKDRDKLS